MVPRGVLTRRYYLASAIALAMALYGVLHLSYVKTREQVCPWPVTGFERPSVWATLKRWLRAVRERRLFAVVRPGPSPSEWPNRAVAERAATTLGSMAPPGLQYRPWTERAYAGAQTL